MKQALPAAWPSSRRHSRQAVATVWALVVLTVLTAVMAAVTWQLLTSRRLLDRRQDQIQTLWLARSGVELAATRLLSNPATYEGESLELIPGTEIRIQVRKESDSPSTYLVTSEARYARGSPAAVARSITRRFRRVTEKERMRIEVVATDAPVKGDGGDQPNTNGKKRPVSAPKSDTTSEQPLPAGPVRDFQCLGKTPPINQQCLSLVVALSYLKGVKTTWQAKR